MVPYPRQALRIARALKIAPESLLDVVAEPSVPVLKMG